MESSDGKWNLFFSWIEKWVFVFFSSASFCFVLEGESQQLRESAKFCFIFITETGLEEFPLFSNFLFFNSCGLSLASFHLFSNKYLSKISYTLEETTKTTKIQNFQFFWKFQKIDTKKLPTSSRKPIFRSPVFWKSNFCSSSAIFGQIWTIFFKKRDPMVTRFCFNPS